MISFQYFLQRLLPSVLTVSIISLIKRLSLTTKIVIVVFIEGLLGARQCAGYMAHVNPITRSRNGSKATLNRLVKVTK